MKNMIKLIDLEKPKNHDHDEQGLLSVTHKSLAELLGRQPTRQELWRAHLCFKRMAFTLIEYVSHQI